jgi:3-hydroxyisobutyrate dehydrogenase-like beta-hydroxyacid dehydrogenase
MSLLTRSEVKLGFVGLGNMGSRIVQSLLNHGYRVTVYDHSKTKIDAMTASGAVAAASIAELARNADVILSCVTNDEAVQSIYYGMEGVLANAKPGTVVLEMSTVFPTTSRELHQRGAERHVEVLDVAISGSTPAAEQGTLTLLAGGDAQLFEAAQPLFRTISAHSFHMGASGAGTTMKLVVNTLLGVGMQAIAEAIPLGEKAGIDRDRLLDVLSQTAVIAPAHVGKLSRTAREDYSPQFPLRLMNKDFNLILEAAKSLHVLMPATTAAFGINAMELSDNPDADFSAVIRKMEELAQITPPASVPDTPTLA